MSAPRRLSRTLIDRLENVRRHLEALRTPGDERCGIDDNVKRDVRLYVQSWIDPDIEALLAWARGERTIAELDQSHPSSLMSGKRSRGCDGPYHENGGPCPCAACNPSRRR